MARARLQPRRIPCPECGPNWMPKNGAPRAARSIAAATADAITPKGAAGTRLNATQQAKLSATAAILPHQRSPNNGPPVTTASPTRPSAPSFRTPYRHSEPY